MELKWQQAERVELVEGYTVQARDRRPTGAVNDVRIAIQGGFVHIAYPGDSQVQIVSAPAVRRVVYTAAPDCEGTAV